MANELFSTRGEDSKRLELLRSIRPYRHLVCSIEQLGISGPIDFKILINEFGSNFIKLDSVTTVDGNYYFDVLPDYFKNKDKVVVDANWSFTTITPIPHLSINFTNSSFVKLLVSTLDWVSNAVSMEGKIYFSIREYYG